MKWESAAACALAVLVTAACSDSKAPAPAASAAPASGEAGTTGGAAETKAAPSEYGVPECDAFMKAWAACVDSKVPAEQRAVYKQSFDAAKASYTQAASTPQGKAGLAMVCTQQLAATKQALAAYNCTW
jgi:hypothetical protein